MLGTGALGLGTGALGLVVVSTAVLGSGALGLAVVTAVLGTGALGLVVVTAAVLGTAEAALWSAWTGSCQAVVGPGLLAGLGGVSCALGTGLVSQLLARKFGNGVFAGLGGVSCGLGTGVHGGFETGLAGPVLGTVGHWSTWTGHCHGCCRTTGSITCIDLPATKPLNFLVVGLLNSRDMLSRM